MKSILKLIVSATIVIFISSTAYAYTDNTSTQIETDGTKTTYTYSPINGNYGLGVGFEPDIEDLEHGEHYTWGMELDIPNINEVSITSASITFLDIYNSTGDFYDLYVRLLDKQPGTESNEDILGGLRGYEDTNDTNDDLAGEGIQVAHYSGTDTKVDEIPIKRDDRKTVIYNFDAAELIALNDFALDGIVGLGFDPDCHFYNHGVFFSLTTEPTGAVPEPSTMLLFGTGLAGLASAARRKRN